MRFSDEDIVGIGFSRGRWFPREFTDVFTIYPIAMCAIINLRDDMLPLVKFNFPVANATGSADAEMQAFARKFGIETVGTGAVTLGNDALPPLAAGALVAFGINPRHHGDAFIDGEDVFVGDFHPVAFTVELQCLAEFTVNVFRCSGYLSVILISRMIDGVVTIKFIKREVEDERLIRFVLRIGERCRTHEQD